MYSPCPRIRWIVMNRTERRVRYITLRLYLRWLFKWHDYKNICRLPSCRKWLRSGKTKHKIVIEIYIVTHSGIEIDHLKCPPTQYIELWLTIFPHLYDVLNGNIVLTTPFGTQRRKLFNCYDYQRCEWSSVKDSFWTKGNKLLWDKSHIPKITQTKIGKPGRCLILERL